MGQPRPLFKIYRKTVGFRGIRTRIVGLEGEHAVHLTTTTTAQTAIILLSTVWKGENRVLEWTIYNSALK